MPLVSRSSNLGTRPIDPAGGCAYAPGSTGSPLKNFATFCMKWSNLRPFKP